jgi:hypothetical protein
MAALLEDFEEPSRTQVIAESTISDVSSQRMVMARALARIIPEAT